jgi:hypothetical protein
VPREQLNFATLTRIKGRPAIVIGIATALLVAGVSLPVGFRKIPKESPARDALALIQTLDAQLASRSSDDGLADQAFGAARGVLRRDIFSSESLMRKPAAAPREETPRPREAPTVPSELEIMGIFVDGHMRQAVISGRRVAEGDSIGGYWVIEITRESVLLWNDGGFKTLTWGNDR